MKCPFCTRVAAGPLITKSELAAAFDDRFPISAGHTLIVPIRHVPDFFDLSEDEQAAVWSLVAEVRQALLAQHSPAGFNIGINAGEAAGQTVPHAHVHVIPRYSGDVADPRGGVRWVIPELAAWWEKDQ